MIIGIPREMKQGEYRVGMIPAGVEELKRAGHTVVVQTQAGAGSGIADDQYAAAGAEVVASARDVFSRAELIVKVKEPQPIEIAMMRPGQVVFAFFHFAADRALTEAVLGSGIVAIAYETIRDKRGHLPLLTPMSEIAGKLSIQQGTKCLELPMMGRGILLGGVAGVESGTVLILGGGVVGSNAAKMAAGLGARVIILDVDIERLRYLDDIMPANVEMVFSDRYTLRQYLPQADLVVGAVLIPGARCPVLVRHDDLKRMKPGAVIVDPDIDQGGCVETARPTTHSDPTYVVDQIVHYAVTNMAGAVSRTSTFALCNATLPYVLQLANVGYRRAAALDPGLLAGINTQEGRLTNEAVAHTFHLHYQPAVLAS